MDERLKRAFHDFSALSKTEKQKRVVHWVKTSNAKLIPLLKEIASSDPEVQIRYLARKGLHHLNQRAGSEDSQSQLFKNFDEVKTLLSANNPSQTSKCLEAAYKQFPEETQAFVEETLPKLTDPYLVSSYLLTLGRLGNESNLEFLKNYVEAADARVRASAVEALGLLALPEATPYLIRALSEEDNRVRANAIRALKSQGRRPVFVALKQMAQAEKVWMRDSAAFAIGEYKSEEALEVLAILLNDPMESVRRMAYRSLEKLSSSQVIKAEMLLKSLENLKTQESILDFLQLSDDQQQEESNQLHSEDSRQRLLEINKIVNEALSERYRELEERLVVEEDNFVCASLILALGRVGQESAVNLIKSFLKSSVPRLRANAIEALASFSKVEYLPEVLLHLNDSNNRARANAILALSKMPYVNVYQALEEMVSSDQKLDLQSAFYVITELNDDPSRALLETVIQNCADAHLLDNLKSHLEMISEEYPKAEELLKTYASKLQINESEEEVGPEQEELTGGMSEVDFEGFTPDDLKEVKVESVEMDGFLKASPEQKVLMLEFMKTEISQEHYTILRMAAKDKDFQVKCLARIALNAYKGQDFEDVNLDGIEIGQNGILKKNIHGFLPSVGVERKKVQYEGELTIPQLNMELQRRAQFVKDGGSWQGRFTEDFPLLSALRLDTQEMLCTILGEDQFQLQYAGLCYFSPSFKPFLEGVKSLDGMNYENFIQLNTVKSVLLAEMNPDPVTEMLCSTASPKYLLYLITQSSFLLFLRYTLAYRRAEYVKIDRELILGSEIKKQGNDNQVLLQLKDKTVLELPKLQLKGAQDLQALLNGTSKD